MSLSDEAKNALNELTPLICEILNDPEVAQEFANNPDDFCQRRGYNFSFKLDKSLTNLLIALGDKDVNEALRNRDFGQFLTVCSEKGLLKTEETLELNVLFKDNQDRALFDALASQLSGAQTRDASTDIAFWFSVAVAVVLAAVVVYVVGIDEDTGDSSGDSSDPNEDNLAQERSSLYKADLLDKSQNNLMADSKSMQKNRRSFLHNQNSGHSILDIWALKNPQIDTWQFVPLYKDFIAQQIVDQIKVTKPEVLKNFSEIQLLEFLKRNMIV